MFIPSRLVFWNKRSYLYEFNYAGSCSQRSISTGHATTFISASAVSKSWASKKQTAWSKAAGI